ncbi:hypothetical protein RhiirB3_447292 [Rhizophagus irregularis]|nr:hypothetical protein RhiirB3_447292 [Rhizophagus irregularis]
MKSSLQASAIPFKNDVGQSIQNPEGIDFEGSLHSTEDYISVIRLIINIPELCAYLEENILIAPMDYP